MNNVLHHAHLGIREDGLNLKDENSWWMFVQLRDDNITVVFCDLGLGIPKTLPIVRPGLWKKLISLNVTQDANIIEHALQDSVSRLQTTGRGKGLKQLIEVVTKTNQGTVSILSNKGRLHYNTDGEITMQNYGDSICGTLIHWTIPVQSQIGAS